MTNELSPARAQRDAVMRVAAAREIEPTPEPAPRVSWWRRAIAWVRRQFSR